MDTTEIMDRLILARKRAGLSQTQAAAMVRIFHAPSLSPYEKGDYVLSLPLFLELCDIYGVSPTWALTGINPDFDATSVCEALGRVTADTASIVDLLSSLRQGRNPVCIFPLHDDLHEIRGEFTGKEDD